MIQKTHLHDNVYICGTDQEDYHRCWNEFKKAAKEYKFPFSEEKSVFSTTKLQILGSIVENGTIKPDPQRLQPLRDLPSPNDSKYLDTWSIFPLLKVNTQIS